MPAASRDTAPRPLLSPAELRLLRGLAAGRSMRELATDLNYSYSYLREVRQSAIRRLGAATIIQAIYLATRRGLIR